VNLLSKDSEIDIYSTRNPFVIVFYS